MGEQLGNHFRNLSLIDFIRSRVQAQKRHTKHEREWTRFNTLWKKYARFKVNACMASASFLKSSQRHVLFSYFSFGTSSFKGIRFHLKELPIVGVFSFASPQKCDRLWVKSHSPPNAAIVITEFFKSLFEGRKNNSKLTRGKQLARSPPASSVFHLRGWLSKFVLYDRDCDLNTILSHWFRGPLNRATDIKDRPLWIGPSKSNRRVLISVRWVTSGNSWILFTCIFTVMCAKADWVWRSLVACYGRGTRWNLKYEAVQTTNQWTDSQSVSQTDRLTRVVDGWRAS